YLLQRLHLSDEQLALVGKGETEPIDSNWTKAGKARNRRAEVGGAAATGASKTVVRSLKDRSDEEVVQTQGAPVETPPAPAPQAAPAAAPETSTATTSGEAQTAALVAPAPDPATAQTSAVV